MPMDVRDVLLLQEQLCMPTSSPLCGFFFKKKFSMTLVNMEFRGSFLFQCLIWADGDG